MFSCSFVRNDISITHCGKAKFFCVIFSLTQLNWICIFRRLFAIRAQQPILGSLWAKRAQQQKVLFGQNLYLFLVKCFEYIKQSYKDIFKCNVLIHHLYIWIVNSILKKRCWALLAKKTKYCSVCIGFFKPKGR